MKQEQIQGDDRTRWESVHECPRCGHPVRLANLDLKAVTSGVVTCARCGLTGSINIQIVVLDEPTK
jgi:transcription elongation factor Elf1